MATETEYSERELTSVGLDRSRLPRHVAIIMDGNGRWARERGWPRIEGHRRGVDSVRAVVEESSRLEIELLETFKRNRLSMREIKAGFQGA